MNSQKPKSINHITRILLSILILFYPNNVFFPIFWFPILIPLFVNALAVIVELAMIPQQTTAPFTLTAWNPIMISALRNFQLAFLSTDIWALTTILMYAAKSKLHGLYVWSHSFGVIIGLFVHLLFYLTTLVFAKHSFGLAIAVILFFIGFIGVVMIRLAILHRIEQKEIRDFGKPETIQSIEPQSQEIDKKDLEDDSENAELEE